MRVQLGGLAPGDSDSHGLGRFGRTALVGGSSLI